MGKAKQPSSALQPVGVAKTGVQPVGLAPIELPPVIAEFLSKTGVASTTSFVDISDLDVLADRFLQSDKAEFQMLIWRAANLRALADQRKGDFKPFLARIGRPPSTVYNWFKIFEKAAALQSAESVEALSRIDYTNLVEITAKWSGEEIEALTHGEKVRGLTIEDAAEISKRDLIEQQKKWLEDSDHEIAKWRTKATQAEAQLGDAVKEHDRLARITQRILAEADLPKFALATRQEAMVLTEQMSFALDSLELVAQENLFLEIDHPEAETYQPIAAATMYYALGGIFARVHGLMANLAGTYRHHIAEGLHTKHELKPGELQLFEENRRRLLGQHKAQKEAREIARENSAPGKRGRPLGSKTKK